MIESFGKMYKREYLWTNLHSLITRFTLNKVLPLEVVDIIDNLCYRPKFNCAYFYWIPFQAKKEWNDKRIETSFNLSRIDDITIQMETVNGLIDGKMHVLQHNILEFNQYYG